MKLKKIILNNIRSYKNQELEFPEGSILLSGDIGSGKTSVLLGIEFALFGLQPGQKGSSLLRNGENNGKVILEFEIDDKNILIERNLKRGKSISQEDCSITLNGEKKEISVMELKSRVLELLNYPKEFSKKQNLLYKFTVYTPQEEMKEIILQDPETRINTLRHIFGIDKYKKIIENSFVVASKIREEKRIKEAMVVNMEQDKMELVSRENDLESKHYNLVSVEKEFFLKAEERKKIQNEKDFMQEKINEKSEISREIEKIKMIISHKEDLISENKKMIKQLSLQLKESENLEFDESGILKFEEELKLKKRQKIDLNDLFIKISSEINSLNSKNRENAEIKTRISNVEVCPTCLQEVNVLYKNNILAKINLSILENLKKTEVLNSEKRNAQNRLSEIEMQLGFIEKKIQDYNIIKIKFQNINEKKSRTEELESGNLVLHEEIKILQVNILSKEKFIEKLKEFDFLYEEKQKALEIALKQERLAEIKTAELKKEIEFFNRQIEELKEKIKKTDEIKRQLNHLAEIESWISKKFVFLVSMIERNVMTKLKKEFSNLFSEWFSMLVSESFNVKLDDNFTPVIEQQDYELDYPYLSGGERTAVALAYRLALNQVINSLLSKIKTKDIVVLDEPTDGFSSQQLDKLRDVLAQLNVKQLVIVSHEQKIESFVDNVIRFKKVDGMSVRE